VKNIFELMQQIVNSGGWRMSRFRSKEINYGQGTDIITFMQLNKFGSRHLERIMGVGLIPCNLMGLLDSENSTIQKLWAFNQSKPKMAS